MMRSTVMSDGERLLMIAARRTLGVSLSASLSDVGL